jgi:hypothetical protein
MLAPATVPDTLLRLACRVGITLHRRSENRGRFLLRVRMYRDEGQWEPAVRFNGSATASSGTTTMTMTMTTVGDPIETLLRERANATPTEPQDSGALRKLPVLAS